MRRLKYFKGKTKPKVGRVIPDRESAYNELQLHMAKTIIENSVTFHDGIFRTISSVLAISIPAYIGILAAITPKQKLHLLIQLTPIVFWSGSLIFCVALLTPKIEQFDLRNYSSIVGIYVQSLKRKKKMANWAITFLITGTLCCISVLIYIGIIS